MTNKGKQAGTQIKAATDSVALRNLNRLGGEPKVELEWRRCLRLLAPQQSVGHAVQDAALVIN